MEPTAKKLAKLPLTEWSALMLCMEHWNYIAEYIVENGNKKLSKNWQRPESIKRLISKLLGFKNFECHCVCCEYANNCDECPVWIGDYNTCQEKLVDERWVSGEWDTFTNYPAVESALAIAYLAEEALDRIENDK